VYEWIQVLVPGFLQFFKISADDMFQVLPIMGSQFFIDEHIGFIFNSYTKDLFQGLRYCRLWDLGSMVTF
jgi:hypothetical protein